MTTKPSDGNFNSSEVFKLLSFGKIDMTAEELKARPKEGKGSAVKFKDGGFGDAAITYIQECNWERKLGRTMNQETWAKPTAWGNLLESRAFDLLGGSYQRTGQDTSLVHPQHPYWTGKPDGIGYKLTVPYIVPDSKCPFTLGSFLKFADCANIDEVVKNHPDGYKYKIQLISNACILGLDYAELVVYCPYESELLEIRALAQDGSLESYNERTERWIMGCNPNELPYIKDGGYYKNLYRFQFEVTKEDKQLLTERVVEASKLLIPTQPAPYQVAYIAQGEK